MDMTHFDLLTSAISHRLPLCHIILWFLYNVLHILRLLLYISLIKISKGVSWGGSGIWLGCLLGKHVLLKGGPEVDLGFTSLGWPGNTDTPTGFLLFGVLIFLNCFECPNKKSLMVRGFFFFTLEKQLNRSCLSDVLIYNIRPMKPEHPYLCHLQLHLVFLLSLYRTS